MGESAYTDDSAFGGGIVCYNQKRQCAGIFWIQDFNWKVSIAKITDGTSKTYMIGEDLPKYNRHNAWAYSHEAVATTYAPFNYKPEPAEDFATPRGSTSVGFAATMSAASSLLTRTATSSLPPTTSTSTYTARYQPKTVGS